MADEAPKRKQLLFVDDDPDCLSTITMLLKRMSNGEWAMRTATNHSQALEHLKAQPVDVIVRSAARGCVAMGFTPALLQASRYLAEVPNKVMPSASA